MLKSSGLILQLSEGIGLPVVWGGAIIGIYRAPNEDMLRLKN
jgi:hypothetical protein